MRNVFVIITLSIGVATGFIIFETTTKSLPLFTRSMRGERLRRREETERSKELPSNRTYIDETALYEHASAKQNNQSERAFIYINQKYKKPSLHQYFTLGQNGPEFTRRFAMPQAIPQNIMLPRHYEPCKSEPAQVTSYFQEYDIPGRLPEIASYFASPKLYNCKPQKPSKPNKVSEAMSRMNNYKGDARSDTVSQVHNYNNEYNNYDNYNRKPFNTRRDYIELLKSPLLRPPNRYAKPKYDGIPVPHNSPLSYKDFLMLQHLSKQYNAKANILVDERKNERRNNYGFSPFAHPSYQNKRRLQKIEEPSFDKDLIKDDDFVRTLDKAQDEELLDQYLKDTLEEQVTSKEITVSANDCRYHDCNLHSAKTSSSTGQQKDSKKLECKCEVQSKSKNNESLTRKDRPERRDNKCNHTNPQKPSDITYYEEILTEDSPSKKSSIDPKLISKLNNTLYH